MEIRRIDGPGREAVNAFIERNWFTLQMAVHGELIDLSAAGGWYAAEGGEITGLITCRTRGGEMEILSLDSAVENRGVGSALLEKAVSEARRLGCARVFLITTNDNTRALRFYQRRGFDMVRLYRNALEESRRLKPEIPPVGNDGIPLRHEIELEMLL